ncbi:hypothetical protein N7481_006840 [Penicillium waksmanii]|uniref:uncharacterized protein n=1 Tax=Penicillium waksmanii TaxID=69791 RepID=UPI0025482C8C|nr:uncharacterized protein N7481_006840 [Penicillium waksmanii]KAJ5984741.1 hypothetical protein N7481_006840 [Penicillium waksmanii]
MLKLHYLLAVCWAAVLAYHLRHVRSIANRQYAALLSLPSRDIAVTLKAGHSVDDVNGRPKR